MQKEHLTQLKSVVGAKNVLTEATATKKYAKGFRFGGGTADCVVLPQTLVQMWKVLQICVDADVIIILQAANTGLNGGSTPFGDYDREVVIISTMAIKQLQLINNDEQVIALGGTTLFELENLLNKKGRDPHSVIGSSNLGATIIGGVCNNSGGALIRRGPAYTEMALYAKLDKDRKLHLVNELGINLGSTPEEILDNLEKGKYTQADIQNTGAKCSDTEYMERLRQVDVAEPSRFNNDVRRLFGASGSAGKVAVFAVRLDTFAKPKREQVFCIASNESLNLIELRREILTKLKNFPILCEFMHQDYFNIARKYGKDSIFVINNFGSQAMPKLFALKNWFDSWMTKIPLVPAAISEITMQGLSHLMPRQLPKKLINLNDKYKYQLILKMSDDGIEEAEQFLTEFFANREGEFFKASKKEGEKAIMNRFVAGAAFKRFYLLNKQKYGDIMALDIALNRTDKEWFETLPEEIEQDMAYKGYCGHFMCLVMHQDYILKKGVDAKAVKARLLANFENRGAECPAEHNVGTQYLAKEGLVKFYKELDPTNTFNPGIGLTSKNRNWS